MWDWQRLSERRVMVMMLSPAWRRWERTRPRLYVMVMRPAVAAAASIALAAAAVVSTGADVGTDTAAAMKMVVMMPL